MCIKCCVLYEERLKLFYIEYTFWKCEIIEKKRKEIDLSRLRCAHFSAVVEKSPVARGLN